MYHIMIMDTNDKEIILSGEEVVVIAGEPGDLSGIISADETTIAQAITVSPRLLSASRKAIALSGKT